MNHSAKLKILKVRYLGLLALVCLSIRCHAQESYYERPYPVVGDTIAEYTFTDIVNYNKDKVSISDFRGKWLILDYWAESCSGCLYSFPKMNAIHEKYKDQVQIIMIGANIGRRDDRTILGSESRTKGIYEILKKQHSLSFLVAFDSLLYKKHDIGSLPHLLIIDPKGVLRAKTVSIDSSKIKKLIVGEPVEFEVAFSRTEADEISMFYNNDLPVLTTGGLANGGIDTNFYFRSILAPFDKSHMDYRTITNFEREKLKSQADSSAQNFRIELRGVYLESLYQLAFFGTNYWERYDPLYQKYAKKIKWNGQDEGETRKNDKQRYAYSISVPKNNLNKKYVLKCIQTDLERFFGYKAEIKKIWMPVLYLKVRDKKLVEKLRNTTGISSHKNSEVIWQGFSSTNVSMKSLMLSVGAWVNNLYDLPVYDKTEIDFNLDITISGNLLEPQNGIRELERLGFKLVKGKKKLQTIVLSK